MLIQAIIPEPFSFCIKTGLIVETGSDTEMLTPQNTRYNRPNNRNCHNNNNNNNNRDDRSGNDQLDECQVCKSVPESLLDISNRLTTIERHFLPRSNMGGQQSISVTSLESCDSASNPITNVKNMGRGSSSAQSHQISSTSRSLSRTDLDPFLEHLIQRSPYINETQLPQATREIRRAFPYVEPSLIGKAVKEWFRKRREYMTHRVFNYCNKNFRMQDSGEVLCKLKNDIDMQDFLRRSCNLDVVDDTAARNYIIERVESFFSTRETKKRPRDE